MSSSYSNPYPLAPSDYLVDSSDSNHRDDLPPIYKRKMVWTSSEGDAVSSSNASEQAIPFTAREDATADIARETRAPVVAEAGTSNWQGTSEPLLPQAEKKKKKKSKKAILPDPPGSSLCTERSLLDLRARFDLGEDVYNAFETLYDRTSHGRPENTTLRLIINIQSRFGNQSQPLAGVLTTTLPFKTSFRLANPFDIKCCADSD
ncbi:hypothetical protein; 66888-66148 [Arabidopsis thaliana]|uniref:Uncharacterized protein T4I21.3 n=1 Tax=Arabidopsis thaliana TaxID=3702 RepID=Q9C8Q5_ARATH|nr:hypothetical protein; 66888-66148 [Arabidopsis thaliana]